MSQTPHENIDVPKPGPNTGTFVNHLTLPSPFSPAETGEHQYPPGPPLSAQNQELRGISDHVDGSGPIFSLYLEMASEEDKKMAESWKDDADGILIFVRRHRLCPGLNFTLTAMYRPVYSPLLLRR